MASRKMLLAGVALFATNLLLYLNDVRAKQRLQYKRKKKRQRRAREHSNGENPSKRRKLDQAETSSSSCSSSFDDSDVDSDFSTSSSSSDIDFVTSSSNYESSIESDVETNTEERDAEIDFIDIKNEIEDHVENIDEKANISTNDLGTSDIYEDSVDADVKPTIESIAEIKTETNVLNIEYKDDVKIKEEPDILDCSVEEFSEIADI